MTSATMEKFQFL